MSPILSIQVDDFLVYVSSCASITMIQFQKTWITPGQMLIHGDPFENLINSSQNKQVQLYRFLMSGTQISPL